MMTARLHLTLPAPFESGNLSAVRRLAGELCQAVGRPSDDVELILTELVSNAASAAERAVELHVEATVDGVTVTVSDDGPEWRVPDGAAVGSVEPGGRGLLIVRAISSDVEIERLAGRTVVTATVMTAGRAAI